MTESDKTVDHDQTEWELLDELDQTVSRLVSVVSLAEVLSDAGDVWQYNTGTFEDAMRAFANHLEHCVQQVNDCSSRLFKNYRARRSISETTAALHWPKPKTADVVARAKKIIIAAKKKRKTNGK